MLFYSIINEKKIPKNFIHNERNQQVIEETKWKYFFFSSIVFNNIVFNHVKLICISQSPSKLRYPFSDF